MASNRLTKNTRDIPFRSLKKYLETNNLKNVNRTFKIEFGSNLVMPK